MKNFIEELKITETLLDSIGKMELNRLSLKLMEEYECEDELQSNLLLFFSLNDKDMESVLFEFRKNIILNEVEDKTGKLFLEKNERKISLIINKLNQLSLKETGKPFHLSAALGELNISEKHSEMFDLNIKELFTDTDIKRQKASNCPFGSYPRYVNKMIPWKLQSSFRITTKQRIEDVGCHFEHGPFKNTIKGWVTFSPQVIIMVLLQGWGFKLAANNNHFFYKWWFVIAAGLTPYSCQTLLYARRF